MPKKHNQKFNLKKTQYVHPSLASGKAGHGESSSPASTTVNEKLNQLRISQSPKARPDKVDQITAAVTQKSVPPNLRQVLNIPETAAPRPKPGVRRRRLPGQPAGPAAPQSWMERSQHAPAYLRAKAQKRARYSTEPLEARLRPPDVDKLPGVEMPAKGSLLDQVFKNIALNWEFISEYEQLNLPTLPAGLKSVLLSYLAAFGPENGISVSHLRLLFSSDSEIAGSTSTLEFTRLDLSSLIWNALTLPTFEKYVMDTDKVSYSKERKNTDIKSSSTEILDSWDQEIPEILPTLSINRFSALAYLSLARPDPRSPSLWSSLLSITSKLPLLTHLSLAYWPAPSLTPNSNTASVHAQGSPNPIRLSGTGFYSHTLDNDFDEASNILRRLSLNTVCLEWLDLEGCSSWWPALIWGRGPVSNQNSELQSTLPAASDLEDASQPNTESQDARPSSVQAIEAASEWCSQMSFGPDWNGPWRSVRYLRLSQGWIPSYKSYGTFQGVHSFLLTPLRDYQDRCGEDDAVERAEGVSRSEAIGWLQVEQQARNIKAVIQKRRNGGNVIKVDHGWAVT